MRLAFRFCAPAPSLTQALSKLQPLRSSRLLATLLVLSLAAFVHAQNYTSIVVFGDSLSDTGNVTHLTLTKYGIPIPSPVANYTYGRFTDGFDTAPAAHNYQGVWVEQLAAMLPAHPVVKDSLDGGTNYAYGFATTGSGTSVLTLGSGLNAPFVNVNNVGTQISTYLATHPKITSKTLFVVWAGAIDVLYASKPQDVVDAAIDQASNIQRLIAAGATQFIIPNLPPLGAVPRFNGLPSQALTATQGAVLYNATLAAGVDIVRFFSFGRVQIHMLDVFSLFNHVIASPATYSLNNVTSMSQGVLTANPDLYLFWDDLHPTTRGHNILALAADKLINPHASQLQDFAQR